MRRWLFWRDILLFFGGLSGLLHETLLQKGERPDLLVIFTAMMGLPAFLEGDRRRTRQIEEGDQ